MSKGTIHNQFVTHGVQEIQHHMSFDYAFDCFERVLSVPYRALSQTLDDLAFCYVLKGRMYEAFDTYK